MERILLPDACTADRFLHKLTARKRKRPAAASAASATAATAADAGEAASASKDTNSAATTPPKALRRAYELNAQKPNTESSSSLSSFSSFSTASNGSASSNLSMCSFRTPRARAQRGDTIVIAVVSNHGVDDD
jgi:hypothetical protein